MDTNAIREKLVEAMDAVKTRISELELETADLEYVLQEAVRAVELFDMMGSPKQPAKSSWNPTIAPTAWDKIKETMDTIDPDKKGVRLNALAKAHGQSSGAVGYQLRAHRKEVDRKVKYGHVLWSLK